MPKFRISVKSRRGKVPACFETVIEAENQKDAVNKYRAALVMCNVTVEQIEERRPTLRAAQ